MIQLLISIYGGYFGAGIGILMLAAMGILAAVVDAARERAQGAARAPHQRRRGVAVRRGRRGALADAALMAGASIVGGLLGALLAQRLPPAGMRGFAIAVGLFAAGKMLFGCARP